MRQVTRAGADLSFTVRGDNGPFVMLCHPLTASHLAWSANGVSRALRGLNFRCILPDTIAHGSSDAPLTPDRYRLAEQVADLVAVADAAGASSFSVVGYSMGAWLATGLLQAHPQRVTAASLGGWDPIEGANTFTEATAWTDRQIEWDRQMELGLHDRPTDDPVRSTPGPALWNAYRVLFENRPSLSELHADHIPIQFLCGSFDPYAANVKHAHTMIPSEHVQLDGDHRTSFLEVKYRESVTRFLAQRS